MALCPTCQGRGNIEVAFQFSIGIDGILCRSNYILAPCPDCFAGEYHCCEGERAQPEPDKREGEDG